MGFVLLVLCVCGQVWLLQTLEIKHNCTDEFLPCFNLKRISVDFCRVYFTITDGNTSVQFLKST